MLEMTVQCVPGPEGWRINSSIEEYVSGTLIWCDDAYFILNTICKMRKRLVVVDPWCFPHIYMYLIFFIVTEQS
jgi:hypothetical protein